MPKDDDEKTLGFAFIEYSTPQASLVPTFAVICNETFTRFEWTDIQSCSAEAQSLSGR